MIGHNLEMKPQQIWQYNIRKVIRRLWLIYNHISVKLFHDTIWKLRVFQILVLDFKRKLTSVENRLRHVALKANYTLSNRVTDPIRCIHNSSHSPETAKNCEGSTNASSYAPNQINSKWTMSSSNTSVQVATTELQCEPGAILKNSSCGKTSRLEFHIIFWI